MALTDIHGEPDGYALGYNLHVLLPLELILEVANPVSVGVLLASQVNPYVELLYGPEQIVPLLP